MVSPKKQHLIIAAGLLWLPLVIGGFAFLESHASEPGERGMTIPQWPESSQLHLGDNKKTLLMFLHPHCPCSSASLSELERLLAGEEARVQAQVVFILPKEQTEGWQDSKLWRRAQKIPAVTVHIDSDGQEASLFDSKTSGHTFLFNPDGVRLFDGGITASRGHEGDNEGRASIKALIHNENAQTSTPIFGCSLWKKVLIQVVGRE